MEAAKTRLSKALSRLEEVISSNVINDNSTLIGNSELRKANEILTSRLEYLEARCKVLEEKLQSSEGRARILAEKMVNADSRVGKVMEKLHKFINLERVS